MTAQIASIINGENEDIDIETSDHVWDMQVVELWADILALFEGKGRSGSSIFWSIYIYIYIYIYIDVRQERQPSRASTLAIKSNWAILH